MTKFRKKPVVIEAVQWTKKGLSEVPEWISEALNKLMPLPKETPKQIQVGAMIRMGDELFIATLEGEMKASIGDWIIRGVNGEIYPCKPDVFTKTYDVVL